MRYAELRLPGLKPKPTRTINLIVEALQDQQRGQAAARLAARKAVHHS